MMIRRPHPALVSVLIVTSLCATEAFGQLRHGISAAKGCAGPSCVGELVDCTIEFGYNDDFGDTIRILGAYDVVDLAADHVRVPAVGDLPIIEVGGNTSCQVGGSLPCAIGPPYSTLNGLPGELEPGFVVFGSNTYEIQPDDASPLENQANIAWQDLCDEPTTSNCSSSINHANVPASTLITRCNDDDACTTDSCAAGVCSFDSVCLDPNYNCDDNDVCTADSCNDALAGCCAHEPIPCAQRDCYDNTGCDPVAGCQYESVCTDQNYCNDNDVCTTDVCDEGAAGCCTNEPITCEPRACYNNTGCDPVAGCQYESVCTDQNYCDDNNVCTVDVCDEGVGGCCTHTPVVCEQRPCYELIGCDPVAGCQYASVCDDPNYCDDNDVCTADSCDEGVDGCCAHEPIPCDPPACYNNTGCDPVAGCQYESVCNDPGYCDDNNVCTADSCDEGVAGCCVNDEIPCPQRACYNNSGCDPVAGCQYESVCNNPSYCDDNNVCTVDTCDEALGGCCGHTPVVCEQRPCYTLIGCDPVAGCQYEPIICDDGDLCTDDACNPVSGACSYTPRNCNDGDACTEDRCDPSTGRCINTLLDPPPAGCTDEPGWNKYNWTARWTANESNYLSLYTGLPKGAPPFLGLDNGPDGPGRPDPEHANRRVLRGFVLAWAVDNTGYQVSWNHLSGIATMVRYDDTEAWEYGAYAFQTPHISTPGTRVGAVPGRLELNGADYDAAFSRLLLDFFASGASPFSVPAQASFAMVETDVALLPLIQDLRQNNIGPVHTKATFDVWNSNEDFLSHTDHCLWCWDQVLLSDIALPNNMLLSQLQTDKGKARIDGVASPTVCDAPNCCPRWDEKCNQVFEFYNNGLRAPICSEDTPLVGVANKIIAFSGASSSRAYTGVTLSGQGAEAGRIDSDLPSQPEPLVEAPAGQSSHRTGPVAPVTGQRDALARPVSTGVQGNDIASVPQLDCGAGACERASASKKGSLLVFSSVELKFDGVTQPDGSMAWRLAQDTFLSITNDYPADVDVHFLFVNGDDPQQAVGGNK